MKTITGKLEEVKKLFGFSKDLKLVIDGVSYYGRTKIQRGIEYNLETLSKNTGKFVELEFEERTTVGYDWIIDRLFIISWGIPRKYREIISITSLEEN